MDSAPDAYAADRVGPTATGPSCGKPGVVKDLGMLGAATSGRAPPAGRTRQLHAAGLPGINTLLDPIQYQT